VLPDRFHIFGISEKTVQTWQKQFLMDPDEFGEEHRGKHLRHQFMKGGQFCDQALEWVRANNNITGKKNMTANNFCSWVNSTLFPEARRHHPNLPTKINNHTAV